jgi:FkbM family methyltransferase
MKRKIQFFLQNLLGIQRYLFWLASFQVWKGRWLYADKEFHYFIQLLPEKGMVADIGANLGVTSVQIATEKPGCTIIAFEPIPANFNCCKKIVQKYGSSQIHLYQLALADCPGQLIMTQPTDKGVLMHGLSRVVEIPENTPNCIDVRALSLDEIPEFQPPHQLVAIKIDVENFEWYVLQGGAEVIKANQPVIFCEVWDTVRRELTFSLMGQLGYEIFIFNGQVLEPFRNQRALNFFFLPKKSSFPT